MLRTIAACACLFLPALPLPAQTAAIRVDRQHVLGPVSPYLTGSCLEDVNHEVYGGISSQMIFGESFQEPEAEAGSGASKWWKPEKSGSATGSYALTKDQPLNGAQSQTITFTSGSGMVGLANRGLKGQGMYLAPHAVYQVDLWARTQQFSRLVLSLTDASGHPQKSASVPVDPGSWQKVTATFSDVPETRNGQFEVGLDQPGSIDIGYVSLRPVVMGRFADANVRADVAGKLVEQGVTVMRYGGSMINASDYRWKRMTGPRELRPIDKGTWYGYSSNGWGIPDFCAFAGAAGFLGIPVFNMGEKPEDMVDFLEYARGTPDTKWAAQRIADGHAEPFDLRVIELGNEEIVDEDYWRKFEPIARALWTHDPTLILTVGDLTYANEITDPFHIAGADIGAPRPLTSLAAHQKILALAKEFGAEVWFDVHLWSEDVAKPADIGPLASYEAALQKLADGAKFQVVTYELNANSHDLNRALANARSINKIERLGLEPVVTSANALQVDGQNDNGWNQGLLFMNPEKVWLQPPGYVTQMLARERLDNVVQADCDNAQLDVTGVASAAGNKLALQVINIGDTAVATSIQLAGASSSAQVEELAGPLNGVNTANAPDAIRPREFAWQPSWHDGAASYTFPPHSFTIIRWR
jgi:alpha-L-arabinofuranosidase